MSLRRVLPLLLLAPSLLACRGEAKSVAPGAGRAGKLVRISTGKGFTAALDDRGAVYVIGTVGRGDEATLRQIDFGEPATAISAGSTHLCAVLNSGGLRCIGSNQWGALGLGHTRDIVDPAAEPAVSFGEAIVGVAAGTGYTCARLEGGSLRCWGSAQGGRLGYGNRNDILDPKAAGPVPLGGNARFVETGSLGVTCAALESGGLRCWGQAIQGALGYGTADDVGDRPEATPDKVGDVPLPAKVVDVAVGGAHVCALFESKRVRCWGFGERGRLGIRSDGNIGDDETPEATPDVELGGEAIDVDANSAHTCALLKGGSVRCWGRSVDGALGYGANVEVGHEVTPASAGDVKLPGPVAQIATGPRHTCALLESGDVMCWGLGFDSSEGSASPTKLSFR